MQVGCRLVLSDMRGVMTETARRGNACNRLGRRGFLRRSGWGALALVGASTTARAEAVTINIAAYGGVLNDYLSKVFGQPFTQKTGIKSILAPTPRLPLAKLQVASGSPAQWDMVVLTGAEYLTAVAQDLILPYDYSIIDASHVPPEYKQSHGIKLSLYLFAMSWDRRQIPDDKAPRSWAEFWDTNRFKGKRSLYANISDGSVLEGACWPTALLSTGCIRLMSTGRSAAWSGWGAAISFGTPPTRNRSSS